MGNFLGWLGDNALGLLGLAGSGISAIVNAEQQKMQNAHNEMLVDKQNAAAAAESEKQRAYESAPAQVSRLRSAGMSKAGALGAINGAGGYTPAPVNASQGTAPQVDSSNIVNALQGMAQLSEQKRVNDAVISKTKADEHKSDVEAQKLEIEKKAEELLHSSNEEIRKNFPDLRAFLSDQQFTPSTDSEDIYISTDEIWKKLQDEHKDLYTVTARNAEMRDYVDNYIAYAFDERMRQLGYTTTYQQAKALRQQVKEFLSAENIDTRQKQAHIDNVLASYEESRLTTKGFFNPFSSWENFRLWLKDVFGSRTAQQVIDFGGKYLEHKFLPRRGGK